MSIPPEWIAHGGMLIKDLFDDARKSQEEQQRKQAEASFQANQLMATTREKERESSDDPFCLETAEAKRVFVKAAGPALERLMALKLHGERGSFPCSICDGTAPFSFSTVACSEGDHLVRFGACSWCHMFVPVPESQFRISLKCPLCHGTFRSDGIGPGASVDRFPLITPENLATQLGEAIERIRGARMKYQAALSRITSPE